MSVISIESIKGRRIIGRLEIGDELVSGILRIAEKHRVSAGSVAAIGAVSRIEVSEYGQSQRRYLEPIVRQGDAEILSLVGNISEKDGELFLHAHVTASFITEQSRRSGTVEILGGHLNSATVFACEFAIDAMDDARLVRGPHEATGLALWSKAEKVV